MSDNTQDLGNKLRAKKGAGAHFSGNRVAVEDVLSHLATDHEVQFGDPERRELRPKDLLRQARTRLKAAKVGVSRAKNRRRPGAKTVSDFGLGTGRTPWLHFRNKQHTGVKQRRFGVKARSKRIPRQELDGLFAEWKETFDASPALQALNEAEVKAARARRKRMVEIAAERRRLNLPVDEDDGDADTLPVPHGPSANVEHSLANGVSCVPTESSQASGIRWRLHCSVDFCQSSSTASRQRVGT